jgi:hypothetical protein
MISYFFSSSGTEPWYFYLINGFLNFNVAFALALLVLPLTSLMEYLLQRFHGEWLRRGGFSGRRQQVTRHTNK